MDLVGLEIGYVPNSASFSAPSDRRRFVYYAKKRNIAFETASPDKMYDIVVLNQKADISFWHRYPRGHTKIIYDAVDPYMAVQMEGSWRARARGLFKYISGQSRFMELDYGNTIIEMLKRADAVICSTVEQKELIQPFCKNVHIILDFHGNDIVDSKSKYTRGETVNIIWEGLGTSIIPIKILFDILQPISRETKLSLHIITDIVYYRYGNIYRKQHVVDDVKRRFGSLAKSVFLYQWNVFALSAIATKCDLALIPLDMRDASQRGKPENKLLLFWRMGIPTITSAIPSYKRIMTRCGVDMTCETMFDWHTKIREYLNDESKRMHAGITGRCFAEKYYGEEETLRKWDNLISSI
jgi:hypothetical protein